MDWIRQWMDGWMDFCLYKWMDGWMDGCNACMKWFTHANMDGWLNDEYTRGFSQIRMDDSSDGLIYGHRNGWMKWFVSAQTVARTDVWPRRCATRSQPRSRSLNEERLRRDPVKSPAPSESPHAQIPSSLFSSHINAITPAPNQLSAPRPCRSFVYVQICQRLLLRHYALSGAAAALYIICHINMNYVSLLRARLWIARPCGLSIWYAGPRVEEC